MADRLEHSLDLAVAALVNRQLDPRAVEAADVRRAGRPVLQLDPRRAASARSSSLGCVHVSTS